MKTFISVVRTFNNVSKHLVIVMSKANKTEEISQDELEALLASNVVKEVSRTNGSMLTFTFFNGEI